VKEIKRVTMVLNNALEGKEYLVGDKCTYADLSFVTWGKYSLSVQLFPNLKMSLKAEC